MPRLARLIPAALFVPVLALAGCAPSGGPTAEPTGVPVVASTNVYGSIAQLIGGDHLSVTSLIDSAAQDPHSFEASAQDHLTLSEAALVIENGGGYDPFVRTLLSALDSTVPVLTALDVAGTVDGANEHIWYDFDAMDALGRELATRLSELDPENAADYASGATEFSADLAELGSRADLLRDQWEGTGVAVTEPVPLYLLARLGFDNHTPTEFSEAIEEGTDVPPLVLQETLAIVTSGEVALLAYNDQTASRETEELLSAAAAAGVAVVSFTETLPADADYLSWMTDNLDALESALA